MPTPVVPRHALPSETPPPRRGLRAGLIGGLAVLLAAGGGYWWWHDHRSASANACANAPTLAVSPTLTSAFEQLTSNYADTQNKSCAPIKLVSDESVITSQSVGSAQGWVPEDVSEVAAVGGLDHASSTVVASSPVVLVYAKQVQDALDAKKTSLTGSTLTDLLTAKKTWADLGQKWGPLRLVVPDPGTSVVGVTGFGALASLVAGNGTPTTDQAVFTKNGANLAQIQYHVVQTTKLPTEVPANLAAKASDDTGQGPAGPRVGLTSEYALLSTKPTADSLRAIPLLGGASGVQIPIVNAASDPVISDFTAWLTSDAGQAKVAALGLRTKDHAPDAAMLGTVQLPDKLPVAAQPNTASGVEQMRRLWTTFSRRLAITTMIDASGSMADPIPGSSVRKIDLVTQASASSWQQWPAGTTSAMFTFNADNFLTPHINLVVPQFTTGSGEAAKKVQQYGEKLGQLPVGGGTPLYQAIWTGYQFALSNYHADKANVVVVVTDGRDEDATENVNLYYLTKRLQEADKSKPIQMMYVALGPDADYPTLNKLAQETGGKAAWAKDAASLPTVMQQIMGA